MSKGHRTAEVSRRLVDAYVTSLRQRLPTHCIRQLDKLPKAQEHQLTRLRQAYPGTPPELLYLLQRVNGTCWEMLQGPPGSVPPPASAKVTGTSLKGEGGVPATFAATATTAPPSSAPAATSTATADPPAASASPATPTKPAAASSASAEASARGVNKATAAAAMASEAAAFIKSKIVKKVSTIGAPRRRRPLPHFVALPILGSTYRCCPYYLKSVDQMLVAEQQFPPPTATLPDQGEGWVPSSAAAATQSSPPPLPPPPSTPSSSLPADPVPTGAGLNDTVGVAGQGSCEGGAAGTTRGSPPPTASGAALNTHCISSVYAGCRIVYSAPPTSLPLPPSPPGTSGASNTAASYEIATGDANASLATNLTPASCSEEPRLVYVDPRIDIHASFYQWLAFADSVQPHVRGPAPTIPDADPAKVKAASAAGNAADKCRFSPARTPSQTYTPPPPPPKQFAASRLYIDFKPVELHGGVYGQVIQFVHGKPDSFSVVASDFGEYLKYIMAEEYGFTEELEAGDDDDDADVGAQKARRNDLPLTGPAPSIITTDGRPLTSPTPSQTDVRTKR
ncbi:hypothetical protein JKF63_04615 [Porcisia hertigi]|uniref:Uncharacterized protein n=1 Tax=Porcisia hertigi TaxID=2761500 RepID=A0A836I1F1_9TRYP|nr:hypothetical protein JKF63_04615 [Porcisia hertigi]